MRAALLLALFAVAAVANVAKADNITVAKQLVPDNSNFPQPGARPPLWKFRTLADSTLNTPTGPDAKGRYFMTVTHKPLFNVTDKMMMWFFENLATGKSVSPLDGQTYPNFLLMHPRDHIYHSSTKIPLKNGATATFQEFPLTGCTGSKAEGWTCPTLGETNPGYTTLTPNSTWQFIDQVNGTPKVKNFNKKGIEFHSIGCGAACVTVVNTKQSWKYDPVQNQLQLTTDLRVGITYQKYNEKIVNGWRNGMNPLVKLNRLALHYTEEYGTLENWLPQAYYAAGGDKKKRGH